jgi:Domain of unknown function (DUF4389)
MTAYALQTHPIDLTVSGDVKRSRLTVFFRLLLAIPHLFWMWLWGIAAEVALVLAWVVALFTGRVPGGLHSFLAAYLRYYTRVAAYLLLLADPFPPFGGGEGGYAVDVRVAPAEGQSRLTVLFRLILVIPAALLTYVFRMVNEVVAFLGWFYCLFTGRMHAGMQDTSAWLLRYEVQTAAYTLLLTQRYPSLSGGPALQSS